MFQTTPENVFVYYSFESILSGLLTAVLLWAIYKTHALRGRRHLVLLLATLAFLGLAFSLCSTLNFYDFYSQKRLLGEKPEHIASFVFFIFALLLGATYKYSSSAKSGSWKLLMGGAIAGIIDCSIHLGAHPISHWRIHWLTIAVLLLAFLLPVPSRQEPSRGRLSVLLAIVGFSIGFFILFLREQYPAQSWRDLLWAGQNMTFLAALIALARVIESETEDLFIKFFIRLNLTFVLLAGFIILVVASVQRQQYMEFATREAADLMEYVRGHVMYFHDQGQSADEVLGNADITRRIVSEFGKIPSLEIVAVQFDDQRLKMSIDPNGIVEQDIEVGVSPARNHGSEFLIEANRLRLSAPIFVQGRTQGSVELMESLTGMNQQIVRQILITFSAFTLTVVFSGVLVGIIVTQADATIRKQYGELDETHKQLLQAAKLAALGEMAGGVAHEINNPLGVILARSDYLLEMARLKGATDFIDDLKVIQRNSARAGHIIDDLLDFARSHPLNRRTQDLNSILRETIELMRTRLDAENVVLNECLHPLPPASVDRDRIQQVFVNLLNNAVDACGKGGRIWVQTKSESQGHVEISIEDSGNGISIDNRKRIFDPFFTTKKRGTGLGLSVSYRIIEDHGGAIEVASEPGKGARLVVRLPVEGEPPSTANVLG